MSKEVDENYEAYMADVGRDNLANKAIPAKEVTRGGSTSFTMNELAVTMPLITKNHVYQGFESYDLGYNQGTVAQRDADRKSVLYRLRDIAKNEDDLKSFEQRVLELIAELEGS